MQQHGPTNNIRNPETPLAMKAHNFQEEKQITPSSNAAQGNNTTLSGPKGTGFKDESTDKSGNSSQLEQEDYSDIEDEGSSGYRRGGYHPVCIGEVYGSHYRIEKKLGWGHFSTVWLATDVRLQKDHSQKCVAIKIQKSAQHYSEAALDEIELLEQIRSEEPNHKGQERCSKLLDCFFHQGPHGKHVCMVFELLSHNLLWLIKNHNYRGIPMSIVKIITRDCLLALDYLHAHCKIIHTDLKPENILLTRTFSVDLDTIRYHYESLQESFYKSRDFIAQRYYADATENGTKTLTKNQKKRLGKKIKNELHSTFDVQSRPKLEHSDDLEYQIFSSKCPLVNQNATQKIINREVFSKIADFGNACWTHKHFTDDIATRQYRSPEAIVVAGYSTPVDIWALACVVFELITGDYLFDPKGDHVDAYSRDEDHLALMTELLGKFPKSITSMGERSSDFFNRKGQLRRVKDLRYWPLEEVLIEKYLIKTEDALILSSFLKPMLNFHQSLRATAAECLKHPWLQSIQFENQYDEPLGYYEKLSDPQFIEKKREFKGCQNQNESVFDFSELSQHLDEACAGFEKGMYRRRSSSNPLT